MFEYLFIDLDDTILDFKKAEYVAVQKTLRQQGLEPTEEVCQRYSQINQAHWEMLERKEITREQVLVGRFQVLFQELGCDADAEETAKIYAKNLSIGHYFLPGAEEALQQLAPKYKLYLASNGTTWVQEGRLDSANIRQYFQDIFISQQMGANKPAPEYFQRCFARIPGVDLSKTMIVGDSLSSDMLGGKNAGIATCWVNPRHKISATVQPDYEIESLSQLPALLDKLNR